MLFYRIKGILEKGYQPEEEPGRLRKRPGNEWTGEIALKADRFNAKLGDKAFFFAAEIDGKLVKIGALISGAVDFQKNLASFLKATGLEIGEQVIEEVTYDAMRVLLRDACRCCFIEDDDEILERFGMDRIQRMNLNYRDSILEPMTKKEQYETAGRMLAGDDLISELDRIYPDSERERRNSRPERVSGHPVHYIIRTDDMDTEAMIKRILFNALYENGRLRSRRSTFTAYTASSTVSDDLDNLYECSEDGAMVLRYVVPEDSEDDRAYRDRDMLEKLCSVMKKHRNKVLTVFSLPRESSGARQTIYEQLGSVGIVEIAEDFAYKERAEKFLKALAKECGVRTDKKLFAALEDDKGYLTPELREMFNGWYDTKLKTTYYPQYSKIGEARDEVIRSEPKGSAVDELKGMIGLEEAKSIIFRALDFYKAQKIFADKGMNTSRTSMHMLFAGNPGTAKTTVARLFTKIMRDNGVLTKGGIVEVGRSDLVGKYVGWTAPTIKQKFKRASGGVLFIDEAYSLVDDRSGSYGDEAINTIVQEMENHRDDVIVIFAGYPEKMEQFLDKNPGLRSRIAFHVRFEDYTPDELCQIAALTASKSGLLILEDAFEKLRAQFEQASKQPDFGNGRYVRSVIEHARMAQAARLMSMPYDKVTVGDVASLTAEDFAYDFAGYGEDAEAVRPQIGF